MALRGGSGGGGLPPLDAVPIGDGGVGDGSGSGGLQQAAQGSMTMLGGILYRLVSVRGCKGGLRGVVCVFV